MGNTRFINCEFCQTEGRILTNDGGPDDVDHGVCPACNGKRVVEVETQPIEMKDRDTCEICRGSGYSNHPDSGEMCYACDGQGVSKSPPGHELCSSCGRLFKFGDTCPRGGCPCGGDV